jgi:hypothetical protein
VSSGIRITAVDPSSDAAIATACAVRPGNSRFEISAAVATASSAAVAIRDANAKTTSRSASRAWIA